MRKLEVFANCSIIIVALIICATTIKEHWLSDSRAPRPAAVTDSRLLSTHLEVPGVDWESANKTIVMALSTQCHFCQESAPFYKSVSESPAVKSKRIAVMMIFPQSSDEAESFARTKDIHPGRILSMNLQQLGISSTPTMFLVDHAGKIEKMWIGVLSEDQQRQLLGDLKRIS